MRIRKHAARILPSLSIPTQSCAAAAVAGATTTTTTAGRELETHVCELNQSPWDAMAFTPPGSSPLYIYQVLQGVEEVEECGSAGGATRSGQSEDEPAAVSEASGITTTQSSLRPHVKMEGMAEVAPAEEQRRVRKMEVIIRKRNTTNINTKKVNRKNTSSCALEAADDEKAKTEVEVETAAATAVTTCKKSDGKGWHCKRRAQHPHSLCEYHLTQVRSYYSNGGGSTTTNHLLQQQQKQQSVWKIHGGGGGGIDAAKQHAAATTQDHKKNIKKQKKNIKRRDDQSNGNSKSSVRSLNDGGSRTRREPAGSTDFYYYYSGFGPWRGKRRSSGGRDGEDREASNVDVSDGYDGRDSARDGAPSSRVHDQRPDDLDDDDGDDTDGVADVVEQEYEGDDVAGGKRRGRKPVKARSLKSLL